MAQFPSSLSLLCTTPLLPTGISFAVGSPTVLLVICSNNVCNIAIHCIHFFGLENRISVEIPTLSYFSKKNTVLYCMLYEKMDGASVSKKEANAKAPETFVESFGLQEPTKSVA